MGTPHVRVLGRRPNIPVFVVIRPRHLKQKDKISNVNALPHGAFVRLQDRTHALIKYVKVKKEGTQLTTNEASFLG